MNKHEITCPACGYVSVFVSKPKNVLCARCGAVAMRTGLDDGPQLPKSAIDAWRDHCIARRREEGATLREIAAEYCMSHEGVRGRLQKMGLD